MANTGSQRHLKFVKDVDEMKVNVLLSVYYQEQIFNHSVLTICVVIVQL